MPRLKRTKTTWAAAAIVGAAVIPAAAYSPEWIPLWLTLSTAFVGAVPVGVVGGWALAQPVLRLLQPEELFLEPAAGSDSPRGKF